MAINEQGICNILANDGGLVNIDIVYIVYEINALTLATVCWFNNPNIFLAFMLFQFLVMIVKVSELIGQDVSVRS